MYVNDIEGNRMSCSVDMVLLSCLLLSEKNRYKLENGVNKENS